MLEQVLSYLHNWFVSDIQSGTYTIKDGRVELSFLQNGQYFRIIGSVFNDGLYLYDDDLKLKDETFSGTIWALAIPNALIAIVDGIEKWQEKYGDCADSPYTSESFGGYSYTKGSNSEDETGWQAKFAGVLAPYRKLKEMAPIKGGESHQDPSYRRPYNPEYPWR